MQRISKLPFIVKWVFPVFWFGMLAFATIVVLTHDQTHPITLIVPVVMLVIGFFVMKFFVWNLADEVFDGGDYLLVRKGSREQRIPLDDIVNIEHVGFVSPPRVNIMCRTSGTLGTELSFMAPTMLNPFKKPELVRDLIERVDKARIRQGG